MINFHRTIILCTKTNTFFTFPRPQTAFDFHRTIIYEQRQTHSSLSPVRNQRSISIGPSFHEQSKHILCFLRSVISVRFPSNHHLTNKANTFFAFSRPLSAFDSHRAIILRTKQTHSLLYPVRNQRSNSIDLAIILRTKQTHSLLCPVRNQRSSSIEPSFYEQKQTHPLLSPVRNQRSSSIEPSFYE